MNLRPKAWPLDVAAVGDPPISLADAKLHLRVDHSTEDVLIEALVGAAIEHAERFTGLTLTPRIREVVYDAFPDASEDEDGLDLGTWPVLDATIAFTAGGVEDVVSSSSETLIDLQLDNHVRPAVLTATSWPAADARSSAVRVRFTAGFQSATDSTSLPDLLELPDAVRAAVLLMVAHLYRNREASVDKAQVELPLGVEALLRPHRMLTGMA